MYQKFGKVKKRRLLLEGESRELLVCIRMDLLATLTRLLSSTSFVVELMVLLWKL